MLDVIKWSVHGLYDTSIIFSKYIVSDIFDSVLHAPLQRQFFTGMLSAIATLTDSLATSAHA